MVREAKKQAKIVILSNYERVFIEGKEFDVAVDANILTAKILEHIPNLVTVQDILCALENTKVIEFLRAEVFQAYCVKKNLRIDFKDKHGFLPWNTFFHFVRMSMPTYKRTVTFAQWPKSKDTLELIKYEPKKTHALDNLLSFFKPASTQDWVILKALFCTPAWSEGVGKRPIFMISSADHLDNGIKIGKSTVVQVLGDLYNGIIGPFKSNDDDRVICEKLATFKNLAIILFDNVKRTNWSSETLEFLVTTKTMTARRNYIGPVTIDNDFTVCVTLNNPSVSPDLASRSVVIKLDRPNINSRWEEEVKNYIVKNRSDIFSDILFLLSQPEVAKEPVTRFPSWESAILDKIDTMGSDLETYIKDAQINIEAKQDINDFEVFIAEKLQQYFYRIGNETYQVGVNVEVTKIEWVISGVVYNRWYLEWATRTASPIATREGSLLAQKFETMWCPTQYGVIRFSKKLLKGYKLRAKGIEPRIQAHVETVARDRSEIQVKMLNT